jgi:hypothetical protein
MEPSVGDVCIGVKLGRLGRDLGVAILALDIVELPEVGVEMVALSFESAESGDTTTSRFGVNGLNGFIGGLLGEYNLRPLILSAIVPFPFGEIRLSAEAVGVGDETAWFCCLKIFAILAAALLTTGEPIGGDAAPVFMADDVLTGSTVFNGDNFPITAAIGDECVAVLGVADGEVVV